MALGQTHRVTKRTAPAKTKTKTKTKTKAGASDDRVESDVLLAIKPEHLANISSQKKNHEYRKYRLRDGVERLWLYETGGGNGRSAITHIAVIPSDVRRTPGEVPTEPFGIGNEDFNAGLKQSKYGYPVLELYELVKPVKLAEMKSRWGMGGAPMGWRYLGAGLWEDRWGGEEGRDDKVKKLF
ncbi:uncharacterized protein B0H64DRAFT_121754 [Chaetomium fimeti]|uniref:ASCH domain-containing protein n=1 Tax=Chaetomium fimeti TaxID=1854472 RepID=A0AAE0HIW2_9PEZI|nr:hypothetical protein B0H64DRAFT_121754 [Chaetomium fimeti]